MGEDGDDGTAGGAATSSYGSRTLTGDTGRDLVYIGVTAEAGSGGIGGAGGMGTVGAATVNTISRPNYFQQDTFAGSAGAGGTGGDGGAGAEATARVTRLTLDLGGGTPGFFDTVSLAATTRAGTGGEGGRGGFGSNSLGNDFSVSTTVPPSGPSSTTIYNTWGTPGGDGGLGGMGGVGGRGLSSFDRITVTGEVVSLSISGSARGGDGGGGGRGSAAGLGSDGGVSADGRDGARGGAATAQVTDLDVNVTNGLMLNITLSATAGSGGAGGYAGGSSMGFDRRIETINGVTERVETRTWTDPGDGGRGGAGGAARAQVVDTTVTGSGAVDSVTITLTATGGTGGRGGFGGNAVESSYYEDATGMYTVVGVSRGMDGANGRHGTATTELRNVDIDLAGGNDTLTLSFYHSGPRAGTIVTSDNVFAGGTGTDELRLWTGNDGRIGVVVDTNEGTLDIGRGTGSAISGFEAFRGSAGRDPFVDGVGDHVYEGRGGADSFVFLAGRAGSDTIQFFEAVDTITLSRFGAAIDSFADVLAAASDVSSGVRIVTGTDSSILIAGRTEAQLVADDFTF